MRWWTSASREEGATQTTSQPWMSGGQILAYRSAWKNPMSCGHGDMITGKKRYSGELVDFQASSPLSSGRVHLYIESQAKGTGDMRGWTRSSKKKKKKQQNVEAGSGDPGEYRDSKCAATELGKPKPCWSWIWRRIRRATRKSSTGLSAGKGKLGKIWASCWMRQGTSWQVCGKAWLCILHHGLYQ